MKERTCGIILGIMNIVLLVVCGIFFLGKDKNAPRILLPECSRVYAAENGTGVLFEGVTAFDEEDGELTDSVVIEKIVADEEKKTATITYGVADNAGNVGKVTCTVNMIVEEAGDIAEEVNEETGEEGTSVHGIAGENGSVEENPQVEEENTEAEEETEEMTGESEEEGSESEENVSAEEEIEEEEAQAEENREVLPTAAEASNSGQNVSSRQDPTRPSIVFKQQEIKAKVGSGPAWVNVIEGLHDDKDNYETLLKSLTISGEYDRTKAGTYDITVTVTDSDGNESNSYPMKIIVEE